MNLKDSVSKMLSNIRVSQCFPIDGSTIKEPFIIIENMEDTPSRWLLAEYENSHEISSRNGVNLLISNAKNAVLQAELCRRGIPWTSESVSTMIRANAVFLDLRAGKTLEPDEAWGACCFIIGGIMGDYPPKGRGYLFKHKLMGVPERNLGPGQMSINTTVWVLLKVLSGFRVSDFKFISPLEIRLNSPLGETIVELPYYYPLESGNKPYFPENIRRVLERELLWDEEKMF